MRKLLLITLILGGALHAMEEPKVLLKVTNDGDEIVYVQALEYIPGSWYGGTYTELSKAVPVEPHKEEVILVDAKSTHKRFLYYHSGSTITPDEVLTRKTIPGNLEKDHTVSVAGVKPDAIAQKMESPISLITIFFSMVIFGKKAPSKIPPEIME